jgi:hypothetical protein
LPKEGAASEKERIQHTAREGNKDEISTWHGASRANPNNMAQRKNRNFRQFSFEGGPTGIVVAREPVSGSGGRNRNRPVVVVAPVPDVCHDDPT